MENNRLTEMNAERLEVLLGNTLEFMYNEFYGPAMIDQYRADLENEIGFTQEEMQVEAKPLIVFLDEAENNVFYKDESSKLYEPCDEEEECEI